jgi:hypothetical protein
MAKAAARNFVSSTRFVGDRTELLSPVWQGLGPALRNETRVSEEPAKAVRAKTYADGTVKLIRVPFGPEWPIQMRPPKDRSTINRQRYSPNPRPP